MGKKKSKKKDIAKRKAKSKLKRKKKQNLRLVKSSPPNDVSFIERPALSDMEVPDGFRAVSMSQGMMEYAQPVMEKAESENIDDLNVALNAATVLWNYTILPEKGNEDRKIKKEIFRQLESAFNLSDKEAVLFFEKMIERKKHLFPVEIQPKHSGTMYIRNELTHLISQFNYNTIDFSSLPIPPDSEDKKLIESIDKMDKYITSATDYDEWENHYFQMEENCSERFRHWLKEKDFEEYCEAFPYHTEIYLNFIYRYIHEDIVTLKSIASIYLEEFFSDYVLRKVIIEPHEYTLFPPAIKLFYKFLSEKNYLDDYVNITGIIDEIEPNFIKILRKRFR